MKVESVLLSGASGFLGKIILRSLTDKYQVITIGRSAENIYRADLGESVPDFTGSFDLVIHALGKAHTVPRSKREADEFFRVNVQGTANLLKGIERTEKLPGAFVFISTVAVYGRSEGELITEDHPLLGNTPYAKSKIDAEGLLTEWCAKKNVALTILRLPLIVGPDPRGNLRDMITMMKRGLYVGVGSGKAKKSVVLATDVAGFIPAVAARGGIYNLTDGMNPSMIELEDAIAAQLGKGKTLRIADAVIRFAARIGDHLGKKFPLNSSRFEKLTSTLTFSDARAKATAGWQPHSVVSNLPNFD
jgi:nucleoside-diphosphate-sugar epimerase